MELVTKIVNCKNQILENNKIISEKSKENERIFKSLIVMLNVLPQDKKERYDKELTSDNWKKYSTTAKIFDDHSNQAE